VAGAIVPPIAKTISARISARIAARIAARISARIAARIAATIAAACVSLVGLRVADAHLMPARQGTINLVDRGAFAVVSLPVSSLHGFDDDGDGVMSLTELTRHDADLRAEIDRRFSIFDGETLAHTERVDLVLSPQHDATPDRASEVVALKHATFATPPSDLRVTCDLFGASPSEQALTITATRNKATTPDAEPATFTPTSMDHRLFRRAPAASIAAPPALLGDRAFLSVGAACLLALCWRARATRSSSQPAQTR
jgi:hypothetical protein